ncbi:MAG: histidinol-phosphatase HisJ family protein [Clostridiales bacterium]|nr:histidinol-phosphatase HisJ family protein [Clostridiales bacterium]
MHVHTDNSPDGNHSAIFICEQAQLKGLRAIAFTDHCEVDAYKKDGYDKSMFQAYFDITKAKSIFKGNLIVLTGIELGQPAYDKELAEKILSLYKYDIVIGSIHNLRNKEDFYFLDYKENNVDELLEEYFKEVYEMVKWNGFDTLAHLTYPLRYIKGENGIDVDMGKYMDIIDEILKLLAKNGKALEINTSGLRQKINSLLPDEDIIKRFKSFGGEFVTIGSDAHYANDVGAGVFDGMATARACGFENVTLFQKRFPVTVPIE